LHSPVARQEVINNGPFCANLKIPFNGPLEFHQFTPWFLRPKKIAWYLLDSFHGRKMEDSQSTHSKTPESNIRHKIYSTSKSFA